MQWSRPSRWGLTVLTIVSLTSPSTPPDRLEHLGGAVWLYHCPR